MSKEPKVCMFVSPWHVIQGILNNVMRPTATIIIVIASKSGDLRQTWKHKHVETRTNQKGKRKKNQTQRKAQKTYLFCRKWGEKLEVGGGWMRSPLHRHWKAQKTLKVTPEYSNEGKKFLRIGEEQSLIGFRRICEKDEALFWFLKKWRCVKKKEDAKFCLLQWDEQSRLGRWIGALSQSMVMIVQEDQRVR